MEGQAEKAEGLGQWVLLTECHGSWETKKQKQRKRVFEAQIQAIFSTIKTETREGWLRNLGRALRLLNQEQDWRQEHPFFNPKLETLEKYWRQTSNTITTCAVVLLSFHDEFARESCLGTKNETCWDNIGYWYERKKIGDAGDRTLYLSHAKRALYHLSYIPVLKFNHLLSK